MQVFKKFGLAYKILYAEYSATKLKDGGIVIDYQAFIGIYAVLLLASQGIVIQSECKHSI